MDLTARPISLRVNLLLLFFFSYTALLTLVYGDRMEKTWEAHCMAEQVGLSYREAEQVVESDLFWMNIPDGTLGPHISQSFSMKCSCMQNHEDRRRQNACATKAAKAK